MKTATNLAPGPVIGVLGDTHLEHGSELPPWASETLAQADLIVHLGDLNTSDVLDHLEKIAPVVAVYGATDRGVEDPRIADGHRLIELGGLKIGVARELDGFRVDAAARAAFGDDVAAVVFGATHEPVIGWSDGTLLVNPGSPNLPIEGAEAAVALVTVADGGITARIVTAP